MFFPLGIGPLCGLLARNGASKVVLGAVPLLVFLSPALPQGLGEKDMDNAFHLYDTQMARALAEKVTEHFAAQRYSEGLAELQRLREDHPTAVLELPKGQPAPGAQKSTESMMRYVGIDSWAAELLSRAPREAVELYKNRHQAQAQRSLTRALQLAAHGNHESLVTLARRWPLTTAAARAWIAVGDVEYEAGQPRLARAAWRRAAHSLDPSQPGKDLAAEASSRRDSGPLWAALARRMDAWSPSLNESAQRGLSAIGGQPFKGRAFGNEPEGWPNRLPLPPNPFHTSREGRLRFFPIRVADQLLVSTSRELFCLHAESGELQWRSGRGPLISQLPGWNEIESSVYANRRFSEAVDSRERFVSPAASQSTVVCTFQLPFEVEPEQDYNDLEIIQVLPERRLAAFDLATGEPLWNHFPKGDWDGDSGTYAERFTIASPPLVVGSKVLVQCVRTRGRIQLNVACYDLQTGDLDWSTPLITGQRELNMFGRALKEFVAPPIVHSDGRLFIQTQLGAIASLDLFTGAPLWLTTYDQVVMTSGRWQQGGRMSTVWRNVPPVLVDDLLLATPLDCPDLLCLDMKSGQPRWTISNAILCLGVDPLRGKGVVNHLVGVSHGRVVLGGRRVAAFEAPAGGLSDRPPRRLAWAFPPGTSDPLGAVVAQPLITGSTILVPDTRELVELDARTGRRTGILQWPDDGNLLVEEGVFFITHARGVRGYFEWDDLLARARKAVDQEPQRELPSLRLGQLLVGRAESIVAHAQDARDLSEADRCMREAEEILQGLLTVGRGSSEIGAALFRLYHARSNLSHAGMDMGRAQLALRQALAMAPTLELAAWTRVHLQEVLRGRDEALREVILAEMLALNPDDRILCAVLNERPTRPLWSQRLQPLETMPSSEINLERAMVSVAMFVHSERVRVLLEVDHIPTPNSQGSRGLAQKELYRVLQERVDEPFSIGLNQRTGPRVSHAWQWARVLLQEGFQNHGWRVAPGIEQGAAAALELARNNPDFAQLDAISKRWPFTAAASAARDLSFDHAIAHGNLSLAASFCLGPLPPGWKVEDLSDQTLSQMLRLTGLIADGGNREFPAAFWGRLAADDALRTLPGDTDQPNTVGALASQFEKLRVKPPTIPRPQWESSPTLQVMARGGAVEIARVRESDDAKTTLVLAHGGFLAGYSDGAVAHWNHAVQVRARIAIEPHRSSVSGNLLHLALPGSIETLNLHTGKVVWQTPPAMDAFASVQSSSGLVIASADQGFTQNLIALDATSGTELWRWRKQRTSRTPPLVGDRHIVIWPEARGRALILDLFSGRQTASFPMPRSHAAEREAAFIQDGLLILIPLSRLGTPRDNQLRAIDLATGEERWTINLSKADQQVEALNVLHSQGRTWLVLSARAGSERETSISELFTSRGLLDSSPVARIPSRGKLIGISTQDALHLKDPLVLVADTMQQRILALDLTAGRRWSTALPRDLLTIRGTRTMAPIFGKDRVALVLARKGRDPRTGNPPVLVQLDRSTGRLLGSMDMDRKFRGTQARCSALPFDGGLWFCLDGRSEYYR